MSLSGNTGSGNARNGITLTGSFGQNTILPVNPGFPFVISGVFTLNSGTTLTVPAGSVMKMEYTTSHIYVNGTLSTQGTETDPVYITSLKDDSVGGDTNNDGTATSAAKGDWGRVYVTTTGVATFDHTILRYGGYSSDGTVWLSNNAQATFHQSTVAQSDNYGIRLETPTAGTVAHLTMTNSVVEFSDAYGISASGTSQISITGSTIRNSGLEGIYVSGADGIDLTGNTFTDNAGQAVRLNFSGGTFASLSGNSGSGNARNGITLTGSFGQNTILPVNPGFPFVISGVFTLNSGTTLTVPAGSVMKMEYTTSHIYVNGTLSTQGTETDPVYITSLKDDSVGGDTNNDGTATSAAKGDWGRIYVNSAGSVNLDHTTVAYGGYSSIGNIYNNGGSLTITDSTIRNSKSDGIQQDAGTAVIAGSTIAYNESYGIYAKGVMIVSASNIFSNRNYGIYNGDTTTTIVAENVWWGSDSGPSPYGSGNGINYRTCYNSVLRVYYICQYYVDADPWIGKDYFAQSGLGSNGPGTKNQRIVGDPVNTANGNYAYSYTDLSIPTRGLPLAVSRAYNSLAPQAGPLGWGWTHNWHVFLAEDADGSAMVTFGDGHAEKWTRSGSTYTGAPGIYGILVKNGDGTFDLTQKDQTRYRFSAAGQLAWAEDRNANRTTLAYDGSGKLITVTEPAGRTLTFQYASPVGPTLISRITDHVGRFVQYTYDSASNLVAVTDVTGQPITMAYDGNHRLLTMTDANVHTFVNNIYDDRGRVSQQRDAYNKLWVFAYDEESRFTRVTDPLNRETVYTYDGEWRVVSEKDALNYTVSYTYDDAGNRTRVTDKRGNPTFFAYDHRGNTTIITDTLGGVASMTYDTSGVRNNLLSQSDALNRTTSYVYDASSNLVQRSDPPTSACPAGCVTAWSYDSFGQPASVTDANGHITLTAYDAYGNLLTITDALGQITSAAYDTAGRKLQETDALGRITTYTYDLANRLLIVAEPLGKTTAYAYDNVGNRTQITENGTRITDYAYDAKDRLASVTDPLSHTTTYGYDDVDNLLSATDPLGHATAYTYDQLNRRTSSRDALGNTTSYQYDPNGNRTRLTDANGRATNYAYDQLNRLITVQDAAGGVVSYGYDAVGNRISMTDANNHTTTYSYDAHNRLATVTDPLNNMVSYSYDAVGNRTSQTKADATVLSYGYDELDRLESFTYPGGAVAYAYDAVGNRTTMTDALGVTTYDYDELDRLVQVAGPNGALDYDYDLYGSRTEVTYPGGLTVGYTYDAAGRLIQVSDYAARLTSYDYDDANRPTAIVYPNGVQAVYSYDNADRLLSLVHTSPVSGTIAAAAYTVDNVGNRLSMVDLDGTSNYTYDNLYRLTQVVYPDGETVGYSYDPMGNRTSMTSSLHGVTAYDYDEGDRLLSVTDPGGVTAFTWDANGNMIGKGSAVYTFDALDRLAQVVDGATTVQYAYNGDGVRLGKTVDGVATAYLQDAAAPLPVVLSQTIGGQTSRYVYGSDLLMLEDATSVLSFYHADGLGSTRALSNLAGQKTDGYSYDVFGAVRSHIGSASQAFLFTGEQLDDVTGVVFLRARYYDPSSARFISRDIYPGAINRTETMNRYAYAGDNPINRVDPTGHFFCTAVPGLGVWCDTIGKGVDAPPAQLPELWDMKGEVDKIEPVRKAVPKEALSSFSNLLYGVGLYEGYVSGDLQSFDEDIAAIEGAREYAELFMFYVEQLGIRRPCAWRTTIDENGVAC